MFCIFQVVVIYCLNNSMTVRQIASGEYFFETKVTIGS